MEGLTSIAEYFGVKITLTPSVVLPLLVIATVMVAYGVNWMILRIMHGAVRKSSPAIDGRIAWLLDRYLFPLLALIGLWWILDLAPLPPKVALAADRLLSLAVLGVVIFLVCKGVLLLLRSIAVTYQPLAHVQAPVKIGRASCRERV